MLSCDVAQVPDDLALTDGDGAAIPAAEYTAADARCRKNPPYSYYLYHLRNI
jgi:hypothetical protein